MLTLASCEKRRCYYQITSVEHFQCQALVTYAVAVAAVGVAEADY